VGERETAQRLADLPEVQEVHHIAGEDCYLVKVRARDTEALGRLLRERFGAVPSVRSTRTTIVLETVKESSRLPLPELAGVGHVRA
jgi:Lrp/AsnC family leucine-responsive transcriptional regulator